MAFFISGSETMTYCPIPAKVEYWNGYARWYRRWRTHNDYHGPIIEELKPRRVLVVAEARASGLFNLNQPGYILELVRSYETDSHFAYHDLSEVQAHWEASFGRRPGPEERRSLLRRICFEKGHWWLKERAAVRIFYWRKDDSCIGYG